MQLYDFFSKGLRDNFQTAMVNESSVFKPSKFYCIFIYKGVFWNINIWDTKSWLYEELFTKEQLSC